MLYSFSVFLHLSVDFPGVTKQKMCKENKDSLESQGEDGKTQTGNVVVLQTKSLIKFCIEEISMLQWIYFVRKNIIHDIYNIYPIIHVTSDTSSTVRRSTILLAWVMRRY